MQINEIEEIWQHVFYIWWGEEINMELKNKTLNINDVPGKKHLKLQESNFIKNNEQYNVILANILTRIWQNDPKLHEKMNVGLPSTCPGCTTSVPSTE